jgi:formate hydrogenlyase transcriptional activator
MRATFGRSSSSVQGMKTRVFTGNSIHPGRNTPFGRKVAPVGDGTWMLPGKDSFQTLQLAADSLPNGVLVVGSDGGIVLANHQIERQFGYCRSELIGRSIDMLMPEAGLGDQGFPATAEASSIDISETVCGRRRDGSEFPVELSVNTLRVGPDLYVFASIVDVSARRETEQAASMVLDQRVEFEQFIAELAVKFVNLPADQIIEAIRDALRRVGEILDVDRCTFFRIHDGEVPAAPIAWWGRPGVPTAASTTPLRNQFPWVQETILAGNALIFSALDEIPNPVDRQGYESYGIRACVTVPISVYGHVAGAIAFTMNRIERTWTAETLHTMRFVAAVLGSALARCENDETLRQSILQLEHARDRVRGEDLYLRREAQERVGTGVIIGQSQGIRNVLEQARQVAATDSTVLLLGETGTGKELIATYIHELSARRGRIMVRVNCSAIPSTLMESELFGREKGAFTGALARQIGRFELADHSTVFLDEIGELPADVQVKLLRVLEERQIERLGSPKGVHVDVRIIAATHRNLEKRIAEAAFREDLFYRLNVFPIEVPPLRERVEDIPLLVWRFVDEFSKAFGKRIETISREDMAVLQRYSWPGNIRELRNVVERAMIVSTGTQLALPLPSVSRPAEKRSLKLNDVEKEHILSVLDSCGWRIRGTAGAATMLGLKPTTLEARMAKLGLARPKQR